MFMASIKSSLHRISKVLHMSEAAVYERQRALVRADALRGVEGRGPGSGVELNSHNLATLLIGCGGFMSLSDLNEGVHQYIRAPSSEKVCWMTGRRTLRDAIQATIEGKFIGEHPRVEAIICFNLQAAGADLLWSGGLRLPPGMRFPSTSRFGHAHDWGRGPGIDFRSYVSNEIIEALRSLLVKAGANQ